MAKKKTSSRPLSERGKQKVRKLFSGIDNVQKLNEINTSNLTKVERDYFNKVKAGKTRFLTSFRLSSGQYSKLSEQFIKKTVLPLYKSQGGTAKNLNDAGLNDFIRENIDAFKQAQETIVQPYFYNSDSIEKPLNNFTGDRIFIDDGNGLIQMTKDEAREYIQQQQQNAVNIGAVTFTFIAEFRKGFSQLVLKVPDLSDVEDIDEAAEIFESLGGGLIVSEKKNKKGNEGEKGKNNAKPGRNRKSKNKN